MSMANETYYVSTCVIVNEKDERWAECKKKKVSKEKLAQYAEQLKEYLIKIEYSKYHSYDNSDDDRVEDSESSWDGVKYCEIDPMENGQHLIVQDDKVVGVMFIVRDNRQDEETHVFLFDGAVQEQMSMGYSASHSSNWTYVNKVTLVKRGENGAPQEGNSVNFIQAEMYPSI